MWCVLTESKLKYRIIKKELMRRPARQRTAMSSVYGPAATRAPDSRLLRFVAAWAALKTLLAQSCVVFEPKPLLSEIRGATDSVSKCDGRGVGAMGVDGVDGVDGGDGDTTIDARKRLTAGLGGDVGGDVSERSRSGFGGIRGGVGSRVAEGNADENGSLSSTSDNVNTGDADGPVNGAG
jgi:hypothetical protein